MFPVSWPVKHTLLHMVSRSRYHAIHDALITYFTHCPPDYLDSVFEDCLRVPHTYPDIRLIWRWFQQGWITFNEAAFANVLFHFEMYTRNVQDEIIWLRENPQIIEKIILPFTQYDVPVLLLSHFHQADNTHHCGVVTEFWDEVFKQLFAENLLPRQLIKELLASLTNNVKKVALTGIFV